MSNAYYILFLHVMRDRMLVALKRLCVYKNDPKHSLVKHIDVLYNKLWTFHVIYNEDYELTIEQQMWIVLDSFLDS